MAKPKRHGSITTYSGDLGEKMPYDPFPGIGATQEELDLYYAAQQSEFTRRLKLLFAHYDVDEGDPYKLVVRLALEHVPGFQSEKAPRGPRRNWSPLARAILAIDVHKLLARKDGDGTVSWACRVLAKKSPWSGLLKPRGSADAAKLADALRKQYEKADPEMVARLRAHPHLDLFREEI